MTDAPDAPAPACPSCGHAVRVGAQFCSTCGAPLPDTSGVPTGGGQSASADAAQEPEGAASAPGGVVEVIFAISASLVVAVVGWPILGLPARLLNKAIPAGDCTNRTPGTTAMYLCSAKVGLLTVLGPLLVVVAAVVFRRPLRKLTTAVTAKVPPGARFLAGPVLATGLFTMAFSEIHRSTADDTGFLPQRIFPAVAGMFLYAANKTGPAITRKLPGFMNVRDRVPMALRIPLALVVPLLLAYVITDQDRVTNTALKEQLVILVSLATSYLAIVPRSGQLTHVLRRGVT